MKKWNFYTSKEIKPQGWLKRQLEIQAEGLSGNLHETWPDIRDSAWIGGKRDGWERVPYWLDGFIPLSYLLEDDEMIATVKKYIDAIVSAQQDDGWICPCNKEKRKNTTLGQYNLSAKLSRFITIAQVTKEFRRLFIGFSKTIMNLLKVVKSNCLVGENSDGLSLLFQLISCMKNTMKIG